MPNDAYYYNAINRALEGDYGNIARIRGMYPSWQAAWEARPALHHIQSDRAWEALETHGITLLLNTAPEFPSLLREIPHPPFALYIKGLIPKQHMCAIVGTRKATTSGIAAAKQFAEMLAAHGWCIASGLALGIDAAAHAGALAGNGKTVAVLACGLDTVYPSEHTTLAKRITSEGGALISEYPIGTPALPYRFLERNRIVSGLSKGTLIIEAPERSGSLATARFALEQNREVFVTPGPMGHPNFAGSHALIKAGAALVTTSDDIRAAFGEDISSTAKNKGVAATLSGDEARVYEALAIETRQTIDKLSEVVQLPSYVVSRCLTFLQLKGIIRECGGLYELS